MWLKFIFKESNYKKLFSNNHEKVTKKNETFETPFTTMLTICQKNVNK